MRKAFLLSVCVSVIAGSISAQNISTCSDEDFRLKMRSLVSMGNLYYETSNRLGINLVLDSINTYIAQRSQSENLSEMDSLEFKADWYKLQGSYHYENSYYDSQSLKIAHDYYQKALDIYRTESAFDSDLRCEPMIHRELAQLFYKEENYQEAYNHTKLAYDSFENAFNRQEIEEDDPDYLDIQTQMAICQARMGSTKEALGMMDKLIKAYTPSDVRYGEALRKKAKILMLREEGGGKDSKTDALECYRKFFKLKKDDALNHFLGMNSKEREMYWMRIRPFVTDCYRLEDADAGFLYDVTLFAKGLLLQLDSVGGGRQNIHATWQMIQEKLRPDACAIEFIQYEKYGRQQMGALVLKKTGTPVFVKMASPDSVMQYKTRYSTVRDVLKSFRNDRLSGESSRINGLYRDSVGLFNYIWNTELVGTIGKSCEICFAPDGYIHQLAIEYMLPKGMAHVSCHRLSSTRILLDQKETPSYKNALIVGGVDYNASNTIIANGNDTVAFNYVYNNGNPTTFPNLENSLDEVKEICKLRNDTRDTLLVGAFAMEQSFRQICSNYSVIHISSHGMFSAASTLQGTDLKQNLRDNSLSHSLVAFSGINYTLKKDGFDDNLQDGILSAREMASLDMSKVELVVLCCCETGLGFVTPDGVYGIQRGLKNAGAKAIICTLWDIDDKASSYFMIRFHQYLKENNDLYKAFYQARESMRREYDEPSYRDAFILIDAI